MIEGHGGVGAGQAVDVDGDENTVYAAGGDLFVAGTHVHYDGAEDFFLHTFENFRLTSAPRVAPALVRLLRERTLLVLGGGYDDKPTVARQVARMLAKADAVPGTEPLPVLEWNRGTDFPGLLQALHRQAEPAVLLLVGILPQHVRHDLDGLCTAAAQAGHHVLATTDVPAAGWRLNEREHPLWFALEPDGLFDASTLVGELVHHLCRTRAHLPAGVFTQAHQPEQSTVAGVPLHALAPALRTPPNVVAFVQQLVARAAQPPEPAAVEAATVWELVASATNGAARVEKWFHGVLTPHEQTLALCLSFFDGLFEDQFFAALERWVAHIRAQRDPGQRAFDYADLDNLLTVFAPVEAGLSGTKFESRSPGHRAVLFRAAWRTHRRQIVGALGVLTELAAQSPHGRGTDWELYGSRGRRAQLRRVVAAALGDLGAISEPAVERALLRLASDGNAEVQGTAATAVARWRMDGRDAQLFRLLERWQKDARIRAVVASLMEGTEEKVRSPDANIRSTVALAVGFAVEYDLPNQLTAPLVALIRDLAGDGNRNVRRRFVGVTLPRAVALHLTQLRGLLRDVAGWGLEEAIAQALVYAAGTNPAEVAATLGAWHAEAAALRRDTVDPRRTTVRETLLRVLAYTYGELSYESGRPLSAAAGFGRLKEMLAGESHPAVRDAVVDAMIRQARERFEQVAPLLQQLVGEVTPAEQDDVVRRLTEVYLEQRERLPGGNAQVQVNGRTYPAFVETPRPLTAVEGAMMRWMRDPAHPVAQRIGMRASVAFVEALDGPELAPLADLAARRMRAGAPAEHRIPSAPERAWEAAPGWYAGTLVPWLATRGQPEYQPVVRGLLPEVLALNTARPAPLEFALGRWERMRGDSPATVTASVLRSAMSWHGSAWVLLVFGGFAALVFFFVLLSSH
jgi:hypothetical protein